MSGGTFHRHLYMTTCLALPWICKTVFTLLFEASARKYSDRFISPGWDLVVEKISFFTICIFSHESLTRPLVALQSGLQCLCEWGSPSNFAQRYNFSRYNSWSGKWKGLGYLTVLHRGYTFTLQLLNQIPLKVMPHLSVLSWQIEYVVTENRYISYGLKTVFVYMYDFNFHQSYIWRKQTT